MTHISNIIVTLIITFVVTVGLNFVANCFTQDKGTIAVGPTCTIQGVRHAPQFPFLISVLIPSTTLFYPCPVQSLRPIIIASDPIRVNEETDNAGTANRKQISISGIGHNRSHDIADTRQSGER